MRKKMLQVLTLLAFVIGGIGFVSARAISRTPADQPNPASAAATPYDAQNPCAKKQGQNPCAKKGQNPCNPCAKKGQNPCNPCAKKAQNPCNPCAGKMASGEKYGPAASYGSWKKINSKLLLSQPHGNMLETTFANRIAEAALESKATEFPVGAIFVKETHQNRGGKRGAKGPLFIMEKTASGWLWMTTNETGHITGKGDSQQMQMCAQCHAGASTDAAFLRKK